MPLPLTLAAALRKDEDVRHCSFDGNCARNFNDAGHWLAGSRSIIRKADQRIYVVRQYESSLLCRPCQDFWVTFGTKSHVLGADNIQARMACGNGAKEIAVKALVGQETKHVLLPLAPSGQQLLAKAMTVLAVLNLLPKFLRSLTPLGQIRIDLGRMTQVLTDRGVDVGQWHRIISRCNLLGGRAQFVLRNQDVEGNARSPNADGTVVTHFQRN